MAAQSLAIFPVLGGITGSTRTISKGVVGHSKGEFVAFPVVISHGIRWAHDLSG